MGVGTFIWSVFKIYTLHIFVHRPITPPPVIQHLDKWLKYTISFWEVGVHFGVSGTFVFVGTPIFVGWTQTVVGAVGGEVVRVTRSFEDGAEVGGVGFTDFTVTPVDDYLFDRHLVFVSVGEELDGGGVREGGDADIAVGFVVYTIFLTSAIKKIFILTQSIGLIICGKGCFSASLKYTSDLQICTIS